MFKNKKVTMILSFSLGFVLLAGTALADISSKSGYDQLKDSLKTTAKNLTQGQSNYTVEGKVVIKDNTNTVLTANYNIKSNTATNSTETTSVQQTTNGIPSKEYRFSDNKSSISYDSKSDIYYLTDYNKELDQKTISNPFEDENAKDIEKIVDAVAGSFKDYVTSSPQNDGGQLITFSISDTQIPSVINAVSSMLFKQRFSQRDMRQEEKPIPELVDDIFIQSAKTSASVDKDGILIEATALGVLSGKEKTGTSHSLTFEVSYKLLNVNSTIVQKPDLEGKKVEKRTDYNKEQKATDKFNGKYKNDIIIEKDGKYIKIGERFVVVSHIDDKVAEGKYYEVYKKDYASYYNTKNDFTFSAEFRSAMDNKGKPIVTSSAEFKYTNQSSTNNTGNIYFDNYSGSISFGIQVAPGSLFNGQFARVFED